MEDIRHIENPFVKVFQLVRTDSDKLYSLLLNLIREFLQAVKLPSIVAIASIPAKSQIDLTAYSGSGGYAYTLIRMYRHFLGKSETFMDFASKSGVYGDSLATQLTDPVHFRGLALQQYKLMEHHISKSGRKHKQISFLMSHTSTWVCGVLLAQDFEDAGLLRQNVDRLVATYHHILEGIPDVQWELLYGIPGYLYALLSLHQQYSTHPTPQFRIDFSALITELTTMIVQEGIRAYEQLTKRPAHPGSPDLRLVYSFYNKQYLGGAHGLAGNLNLIFWALRLVPFGERSLQWLPLLSSSVAFLLSHCNNGNLPTSLGKKRFNLVHFCHGAPGLVSCLARFTQLFPEEAARLRVKEAISTSLEHIWRFGVLKKGFGLCHGISGNAYVFLNPALRRVFPQRVEEFQKKAELLAILREEADVMKEIRNYDFEDRDVKGVSDNPFSLMLGIAGDICFAIDVMQREGNFPSFDA